MSILAEEDDRDRPTPRPGESVGRAAWEPTWLLEAEGNQCGATIDDGCMVFLGKDFEGRWGPLTHIPVELVRWANKLVVGEPK